jgi:hypothetical protein
MKKRDLKKKDEKKKDERRLLSRRHRKRRFVGKAVCGIMHGTKLFCRRTNLDCTLECTE